MLALLLIKKCFLYTSIFLHTLANIYSTVISKASHTCICNVVQAICFYALFYICNSVLYIRFVHWIMSLILLPLSSVYLAFINKLIKLLSTEYYAIHVLLQIYFLYVCNYRLCQFILNIQMQIVSLYLILYMQNVCHNNLLYSVHCMSSNISDIPYSRIALVTI